MPVEVEGAPLSMEIDTGAALLLISETIYSQLWPESRVLTLEKSPIRLRTYTEEELKLVGKAVVKVCFENQVLDLLVVEGRTQPARPGLAVEKTAELEGNPQGSHKAGSLEGILTDHSSLFKDELCTIKARYHSLA